MDGADADRDAGLRVAALHLHRVRADVLPDRRRALPVRADGRSGDVRDGLVVHPVAHAGADDGELPAAAACRITTHGGSRRRRAIRWCWFQRGFEARFERIRAGYRDLLTMALAHRAVFVIGFLAFVAASFLLVPFLGRNFFPVGRCRPDPDACRAPRSAPASRRRANQFADIAEGDPPDHPAGRDRRRMVDNIGMPISGINMTYNNTGVIGPQDGDIQIKLQRGPPADRRVRPRAARAAAARVSRRDASRSCRPTSSARS